MKNDLRIVLVLKSGGRYTFEDVERLATALEIHMPLASVYCLYDKDVNQSKIDKVNIIPMPYGGWEGWWSKMNLFSPSTEIEKLRPFLYMDLDTLILDSFEEIIPRNKNLFITLEDFYAKKQIASGLMWIPANNMTDYVWHYWSYNPVGNIRRYRGDQDFLRAVCTVDTYFQDYYDGIADFKPLPRMQPLQERPEKASIVCFHGKPSIPEASKSIEWVRKEINYKANEVIQ